MFCVKVDRPACLSDDGCRIVSCLAECDRFGSADDIGIAMCSDRSRGAG